jgi:hypothetical protein
VNPPHCSLKKRHTRTPSPREGGRFISSRDGHVLPGTIVNQRRTAAAKLFRQHSVGESVRYKSCTPTGVLSLI